MSAEYIIGIDEAGRGPLAGPVTVGLFYVAKILLPEIEEEIFKTGIRDSKKLTAKRREKIFELLNSWHKEGKVMIGHSHVGPDLIDKWGMTKSLAVGVKKVLQPFAVRAEVLEVNLDGLLKAPAVFTNQATIIKGDEKEVAIALASVVAKVTRDNLMKKADLLYPQYKFLANKGYGTQAHIESLKVCGPCPIHRRSFLKKILKD